MRIAISNIAWDVADDENTAALLAKYEVDAIDIAPGKYFPDPTIATDNEIYKVKTYWQDKGIEITGMQSLLFGTQGLNVFGSAKSQQRLLDHIKAVSRIAASLGATRLVFGSPKNRDREGLTDDRALSTAVDFFTRLGSAALEHGVVICLEPNPICYGANFMTTAQETFDVVSAISHPNIKMQLDTGAITINQELIDDVLGYAKNQIGHIHISEPNLAVVGDSQADHAFYAQTINTSFGDALVSIEMVATKNEPHSESIERALMFVTKTYRNV